MTQPIYESPDDIHIADDWIGAPRHPMRARGDQDPPRAIPDVAIIGKTMGRGRSAITRSASERFLLLSLDDEAATKDVLNTLKRLTIEYGIARPTPVPTRFTLPDHATGDLVSGEYYKALPPGRCIRSSQKRSRSRSSSTSADATVDRWLHRRDRMAAFHYDSKNEAR